MVIDSQVTSLCVDDDDEMASGQTGCWFTENRNRIIILPSTSRERFIIRFTPQRSTRLLLWISSKDLFIIRVVE